MVDFSPKGGPSNVNATLTQAGHITWTGDNFWEVFNNYFCFNWSLFAPLRYKTRFVFFRELVTTVHLVVPSTTCLAL
jgi:hypothetical protein